MGSKSIPNRFRFPDFWGSTQRYTVATAIDRPRRAHGGDGGPRPRPPTQTQNVTDGFGMSRIAAVIVARAGWAGDLDVTFGRELDHD